jgi:2'-5' RNA ligase
MWFQQILFSETIAFLLSLYNKSTIITTTTTNNNNMAASDPYKSSRFIGHSLWMVPREGSATVKAYSEIVSQTAQELNTFDFLPHITLVAAITTGEEDVLKRTRELGKQLAPYQYELDGISYRDAYFQCVYATYQRTPEVVAANELARQVFPEKQSDPPYMPHLSLIYGDLTEEEKTKTVIPKLEKAFEQRSDYTHTIQVDAIQLWSTQGDVAEWYVVETIPLTGNSNGTKNSEE